MPNDNRYDTDNPYLSSLVAACKHFRITTFDENNEFWTLGHHWNEYRQLKALGLTFKPNSYHNVDSEDLPKGPKGTVAHPHSEFLHIHEYWNKPKLINFDCTNVITDGNTPIINSLIRLTIRALQHNSTIILSINLMTGYGGTYSWKQQDPDKVIETWIHAIQKHHHHLHNKLYFYNSDKSTLTTEITKRENSATPMLHFHTMITRPQQKS